MAIEDALRLAGQHGSSLTSSFWFGKFLQLLHDEEAIKEDHPLSLSSFRTTLSNHDSTINTVTPNPEVIQRERIKVTSDLSSRNCEDRRPQIEKALKCLKHCETSLSPNVYDLVINSTHSIPSRLLSSIAESSLLLKDSTLDWNTVSILFDKDEYKDHSSGARVCAAMAKKVYKEMSQGGPEMFAALKKRDNFSWTQSPQLFVECIEQLQGEDLLRVHISLLLGTAAFERALGDVYLAVSKATQCPPLLRDLLSTAELSDVFGKSTMYMLSCMIGPPSCLNLRNIIWHGFASPSEISQEFAFLFFVIVSSIGKFLQTISPSLPLNHRPFITFPQETSFANIFPELNDCDLLAIENLFPRSFFILPTMLPTWKAALGAFKSGRHGLCVALLLPCLEHSLRRVFACVNGCPERALTAESTTLYTTFDEILSPTLPNGDENRLKTELGVPKMEMLLDLLVHTEGPRVRDRISHGEVDFCKLSKIVSNHVISMATMFCLQYSIGVDRHSEPIYRTCLAQEMKYISLFHPISLLKNELKQLLSVLHNWRDIPKPDFWKDEALELSVDLDVFKPVFQSFRSSCKLCLPVEESTFVQVEELIATVWEKPIKTLYVSRSDLEVTGIMRRIVENAHTSVSQICETASLRFKQYQERQLRSRQRPNYEHLLKSLRLYSNSMMVLVALLVSVAANNLSCEETDSSNKILIRFLKKVLQFVENFTSQSSSTRNRWEEADKLCTSLAAVLTKQLPNSIIQSLYH